MKKEKLYNIWDYIKNLIDIGCIILFIALKIIMDISYISGFPKEQSHSMRHFVKKYFNVVQEHECDINQLHIPVFKTHLSASELNSSVHFLNYIF